MSKPLTTGQLAHDDLVLDSHTASLFDEKYHTGKIEHLFHLQFMESTDLTFGGRMARLRTGEVVAVIQERNADGTPHCGCDGRGQVCFIVENPRHQWFGNRAAPEEGQSLETWADEFWQLFDRSNDSFFSSPSDFYSLLSRAPWWRCHYEEDMRIACLLGPMGECHIQEINSDERPRHAQRVDVEEKIELSFLGIAANDSFAERQITFLTLSDQDFHVWMSANMHDPEEELCQLIRFWGQSEEDRCMEVLGCTTSVRKEAEAMFREILTLGIQEGQSLAQTGFLEDNTEVVWKPWAWDALMAWYGKGIYHYTSVLDTIHNERLAVLALKQCRLPAYCTESQTAPGRAKRWVGYKWAVQFEVEVPIVALSAHEIALMIST